jgi:hypothetical protein
VIPNKFADIRTVVLPGSSGRSIPLFGQIPKGEPRSSTEMGPDPASHKRMVRWCNRRMLNADVTHLRGNRIVPNYDLAPDLGHIDILRVVVKENFTEALLDRLMIDLVSHEC